MTKTAYLVSHTHWDREWYRTFQQFRLDLVRTVDGILDTLERDATFTHFLLDGQTVVLDDYLAMRPHAGERLRHRIASGRLAVGPWYCHPDLFLVSGEAIVRNLALGMRMARDYGRSMMVGYVPDQFGHPAQLPQIFAGFGIDSAALWRGVDAGSTPNETWWEAPDGSRVLLELLAQSYSNAQLLPVSEPAALAGRLRQLCELLESHATGPGVLLMNGNDHLPIQARLPEALGAANELLAPDWRVEQTDLQTAIARLREAGHPAEVLRGELRAAATVHLLPGVLSTRTYLKQRNATIQGLLERQAEPYAVFAHLQGVPYPMGELWEAWRQLLQNHPHDSICGCSIDQVHREMVTRFDEAEQIAVALTDRALDGLASAIDTTPPSGSPTHTTPIVVVNGGETPRTERVRLDVQLPGVTDGYELVDADGRPVLHHWSGNAGGEPSTVMDVPRDTIPSPETLIAQLEDNRFMGMGVQSIRAEALPAGLFIEATVGDSGIMSRLELEEQVWRVDALLRDTDPAPVTMHLHHAAHHELELLAPAVPPHGYTTLWLRPTDEGEPSPPEPSPPEPSPPEPSPPEPSPPEPSPPTPLPAAGEGGTVATGSAGRSLRCSPVPVTVESVGGESSDDASRAVVGGAADATGRYRIATDLLTVEADPASGALTVTDHGGVSYGPCNVFVDGGDAGDSYTYAAPAVDTTVARPSAPPAIRVEADPLGGRLRIEQELSVPASLTEGRDARSRERATLRISSTVTLTMGCPRVDIETTVDNTAAAHRLRATFGVPFLTDHVHTEQAFDVIQRGLDGHAVAAPPRRTADGIEDPGATAPQQSFVVLHADSSGADGNKAEYGLALTNVGLHEYEAYRSADGTGTTIALTLLRCVGWLSRDDLSTRRGGAGPQMAVPEAQCLGKHTFSYSLLPYAGAWQAIVSQARQTHLPLRALTAAPVTGPLPSSASFLSVDAPGVQVSALKGAEDGNGIVLRLFNVGDGPASGTLRLLHPALCVERLSLDERTIELLAEAEGADEPGITQFPLEIGPHRIETLRIVPITQAP